MDNWKKNDGFNTDSLTQIISSGKSVCAILMAIMADQQRFKYSDTVASHWPDFAKNEKGEIKIEDVLRHEAGLNRLSVQINPEQVHLQNIKNNEAGKLFEDEILNYPGDRKRTYHSTTRDILTNEIFRRVESEGRTYGEFLRDVINPEHGLDIVLGANDEELKRIINWEMKTDWETFKLLWNGPEKVPIVGSLGDMKFLEQQMSVVKEGSADT